MSKINNRKKLLLHICCAGCGAYVSQLLSQDFDVVLYYYNPNIDSISENNRRLQEVERIASHYELKLVKGNYDHNKWLDTVRGYEKEPEKGSRCFICYEMRISDAAFYARDHGFDLFTTTLTVSPHKIAQKIIEIGLQLSKEVKVEFLDTDFKKKDGFKKSLDLSRKLDIYRQNYCGCEFSHRII